MMRRQNRLPVIVAWAVGIFLGLAGLAAQIWGAANTKLKIREYFDGSTADSVRYDLWANGDSVGTGKWSSADSIRDSVTIDPTLGYVIRFKGYFFGLSNVLSWEKSYPARVPVVSDTNILGGAANLTKGDVWDTLVPFYQDSGQYFIGGSGSGVNAATVTTLLDTDSSIIGGVAVRILSPSGSVVAPPLIMSTLGVNSWNASADSFVYTTNAYGYYTTRDTIVVSGTQTDTIFLTAFSPTAPADTFFCTVYGDLRDLRSDATYGPYLRARQKEVCLSATKAVKNACNNTWPSSRDYCVRTNDSGYFEINLVKSQCLLSGSDTVRYQLSVDGNDLMLITVPDSSTYRITF